MVISNVRGRGVYREPDKAGWWWSFWRLSVAHFRMLFRCCVGFSAFNHKSDESNSRKAGLATLGHAYIGIARTYREFCSSVQKQSDQPTTLM